MYSLGSVLWRDFLVFVVFFIKVCVFGCGICWVNIKLICLVIMLLFVVSIVWILVLLVLRVFVKIRVCDSDVLVVIMIWGSKVYFIGYCLLFWFFVGFVVFVIFVCVVLVRFMSVWMVLGFMGFDFWGMVDDLFLEFVLILWILDCMCRIRFLVNFDRVIEICNS